MYKLYGYISKMQMLLSSNNEEDIIEEIGKYIYKNDNIHYIVIEELPDRMLPYRSITTEQEYLEYVDDYLKKDNKNKKSSNVLTKKK